MVADGEESVGGPSAVDIQDQSNHPRESGSIPTFSSSLLISCNKHGFLYLNTEDDTTRTYTGKFGDRKYIKTRRLNIEIILHEHISIKAYYFILNCPLFDLFKVSTGMLNLRNLL